MPDCHDMEARYSRRALLEAGLGIAAALALCRSATVHAVATDAHRSTEWRFFGASEARTVDAIFAPPHREEFRSTYFRFWGGGS